MLTVLLLLYSVDVTWTHLMWGLLNYVCADGKDASVLQSEVRLHLPRYRAKSTAVSILSSYSGKQDVVLADTRACGLLHLSNATCIALAAAVPNQTLEVLPGITVNHSRFHYCWSDTKRPLLSVCSCF